ncbi:MAG: hypothetical protein U0230_11615 [Polyangiales bacterium]
MPLPSRPTPRLRIAMLLASWLVAGVAYAQAAVVVEVRDPGGASADGELVLTPASGGGATYSCRTQAGRCEIAGVPGGQYVAQLRPAQGEQPSPRVVMIPPSGRVTLRVSTR